MLEGFGDRCYLCGRRVWKEGEPLCFWHDWQLVISLPWIDWKQNERSKRISSRVKRLRMSDIERLEN